jgi:hypothetical protein
MLSKLYDLVKVRRKLVMGKGAQIVSTSAAGVETVVDMTELATLGGVTASAAELNIMDGVLATTAELNRVADVSTRLVAAGSTLAVTELAHDGKTILLDTATGSVCTLPAATGSGARFRFVVGTLATSNSHKIQVTGNDIMQGFAMVLQDGGSTALMFETAADSDTITLDRSTTGSTQKGEFFVLEDIATDTWAVWGVVAATGAEATPFSAAV